MKKLQMKLAVFLAVFGIFGGLLVLTPATVGAASPKEEICTGSGGKWTAGNPSANPPTQGSCTNGRAGGTLDGFMKNIVNVLLFVIGAVAVIMIVIGGLRYVMSNGESSAITGAKNTILYAVIGLVVALLAYAIVNFVLGQF